MQPQTNKSRNQSHLATQDQVPRKSTWFGRVVLLVLLLATVAIFWQRQAVSDWFRLVNYQPPPAVSALAQQTTMTDSATHLFYVNQPLIITNANFSQYCSERELTIVLGCYHSGDGGIFLLKIDDASELGGVMEVTAAHEMLHAAYARLSDSERRDIDAKLQTYYDNQLTDQAIKDEIDSYRKTEPGQLLNEMHSIFGTEVRHLPTKLQQYYERYFTNRNAVVDEAERYQEAFRSREAAVAKYDAQLKQLDLTIRGEKAELERLADAITAEKAQMDADKERGNYDAYNSQVPEFNAMVRSFNTLRESLEAHIATYNDIVQKRNAIALEEQQLVEQLKGNSVPTLN